ncbi:CRISPR-associated protein, Cmr4 family [Syntrophus gentianae]|uniref:CRISPR-associated protein, Cmr4 family n=1 Tax=Syntrophus gentianae TaxID=43775 RepID=A0A1H7ZK83_9BACT|nr:type III-B CRISPR module RAMP protein Cmr4 [Syntrophus gentianae]SEM58683.1 CRISPR-associated protein, Cmr4 family [Syntrophus gentianae]
MLKRDLFSICTFYAVSPIHAGTGASFAAVDLPIQRERHTNWPHIQASGVKGAMRAHYRDFAEDKSLINFLFGYDKDDKQHHDTYNSARMKDDQYQVEDNFPGAISFSDAKLLSFPIRSNIAPFVWITCPAVLKRLSNDLAFAGLESIKEIPNITGEMAFCLTGNITGDVILEDMVISVGNAEIGNPIPPGFPVLDRLIFVSDAVYKYAVESCTEIQTQIKIDSKTGTAEGGALRYQELLPADSVLYSVVYYSRAVFDNALQAETVSNHLQGIIKNFMQIGGDETLGRGICKINWISGGSK